MIEVRNGMEACENLGMDDVHFIIYDIYINWMFQNFNFVYICIGKYNNFPIFCCLFNLFVTIYTYCFITFYRVFLHYHAQATQGVTSVIRCG